MIVHRMPFAQYLARPELGSSTLGLAHCRSLAHVRAQLDRPAPPNRAQDLGSLVHCAVLTPEDWMRKVTKTWNSRTKAGKALDAQHRGNVVSQYDYATVAAIFKALFEHPLAGQCLHEARSTGQTEVSAFTSDGRKARFDGIAFGRILDLKTTSDARPESFARSCVTFGYAGQAAHYLDVAQAVGLKVDEFVLIAVETAPPHVVGVYTLSRDFLEAGRLQNQVALQRIRAAQASGIWPGYDHDAVRGPLVRELQMPHGAAYEFADFREQHASVIEAVQEGDDW